MATAFVFETDTMTATDYDDLMAATGLADPDAPYPDGLLAQLRPRAGPRPDGGWHTIDVRESEAVARAFYGSDRFPPSGSTQVTAASPTTPLPMHRTGKRTAAGDRSDRAGTGRGR